ncbi:MAG: TolC family protein [Acidobacteriaceae bacterium]
MIRWISSPLRAATRLLGVFGGACLLCSVVAAQTETTAATQALRAAAPSSQSAAGSSVAAVGSVAAASSVAVAPGAPRISLDEAIHLAEKYAPAFAAATAQMRLAALDHEEAVAGLLPSVVYHNQYLFTQANGTTDRIGQVLNASAPRFIANNAIHEYASQAVVNETLGLREFSAVSVASAEEAQAAAQAEIERRGLIAAVANLYYGVTAADTKMAVTGQAVADANYFVQMTQEREQARQAARADVLKAELTQEQRSRDLEDARLAALKAHLELGALLFADPRTPFDTEATAPPMLPDEATVDEDASRNNPDLKSALATLEASQAEVLSARAEYLPDLGLNVTYGVDAPQFAVNGPDGARNLGYSAMATLDIPVWNWLSTEHKVKQSEIRRDLAKVALSSAQRRLIANLTEFYAEAATARDALASLDKSVSEARESLHLTELRYSAGEGSVLEVVDAQNTLLDTQRAEADGAVRYEVALANLQTLTGRF